MAEELNFWQKGGTSSRKHMSKKRASQLGRTAGIASGTARRAKKAQKPKE